MMRICRPKRVRMLEFTTCASASVSVSVRPRRTTVASVVVRSMLSVSTMHMGHSQLSQTQLQQFMHTCQLALWAGALVEDFSVVQEHIVGAVGEVAAVDEGSVGAVPSSHNLDLETVPPVDVGPACQHSV